MASKWVVVLIFSILQCGLVMSHNPLLKAFSGKIKISPIPVSDLVEQLRREYLSNENDDHYMTMFQIESYGDHLYQLSANLSIECSRIIRATMLMAEKLAICEEVASEMETTYSAARWELSRAKQSQEHPLEVICRRIDKDFVQNTNLSSAFASAKKEAAKFDFTSRRPPYSHELLKSAESLALKVMEMWSVPELARLIVMLSFEDELQPTNEETLRFSYFSRSCVAVAKLPQFEDSMQSIFAKALNDTIPILAAADRFQHIADDSLNWTPKLMKSFYTHIAADPILKKELERAAAVIGKDARKEDLDFSKL